MRRVLVALVACLALATAPTLVAPTSGTSSVAPPALAASPTAFASPTAPPSSAAPTSPASPAPPGPNTPGATATPPSPPNATTNAAADPTAAPPPRIVALYPNPVASEDRGEYVVLALPSDRPGPNGGGNWTLSDGESAVRLPANASGRVAVAADPGAARELADRPVVRAPGFALANGGERLRLLNATGGVADAVAYEDAPSSERWVRGSDPPWRPLGYEPRPVVETGPARATTFVLPDAPEVVDRTLDGADDRVLLAGYTLTSGDVADALVAAERRGVAVRVLLEREPVGGVGRREAAVLDRLVAAGVEVRLLGGPRARFAYHHAKYAVVDDAALVLTENWKPSGTGGRSSRGWGVRVADEPTADALAAVFENDAGWRDAAPWETVRRGRTFPAAPAADGSYPARFQPRTAPVERVRLLTAPGNAESAVVSLVDGAEERVLVVQPTVGGPDQRMLRACVRAAERGVRVRVLLSGAWYVTEENRRLAATLNERAADEGLPLEATVVRPRGRFEKVHAKGLVVDDTVVVGSLNWNDHSANENREVALALDSPVAADYYARVVAADRGAAGGRLPVGLLASVIAAAGVAVVVGRRRVAFE